MIEIFLNWIFHIFQNLGIFGVFLSMFIENIGIPIPTAIGYAIGQDLINNGLYSYFQILMVVTFAHTIGASLAYFGGYWGDNLSRKLKNSNKIAQVHEKLIKWYKKYGDATIFITRFIGYFRPWSSFIAGFSKVKFLPFLIWTFLGSLLFNIGILLISKTLMIIWNKYASLHFTLILIGIFFFFGILIYQIFIWLKRKINKSLID